MAFFNFTFRAKGIKELRQSMKVRKDLVTKGLNKPARRIVTSLLKMVDDKFKLSAAGSPPAGWKEASPLTVFIKKNRASRRRPKPQLLLDSGRLRFGTNPFFRGTTVFRRRAEFGIENKVPYAGVHQFGGTTQSNTVTIGSFTRTVKGRRQRVRGHQMKISGGRPIPARPFFPSRSQYLPIVRRILSDYEKEIGKGGR